MDGGKMRPQRPVIHVMMRVSSVMEVQIVNVIIAP